MFAGFFDIVGWVGCSILRQTVGNPGQTVEADG
jgi:hypothetical protein